MDICGICSKPTIQLFETGKEGLYACIKCQPLTIVPEVSIGDSSGIQDDDDQDMIEVVVEGEREFNCPLCHKGFPKNSQLQNHIRNHKAERRFVCTYCDKAFSQSNNLRAHLRIHTNERPYKCTVCEKAFTQVTNLNNHMRLHTGERPFVCSEPGCGKAYAQVTNLNQHRKRHLNGKPIEDYVCNVCGQHFDQRNDMFKHRREAHYDSLPSKGSGLLRTKCKICGAQLPSGRLLAMHMKEHYDQPADDEDESESSTMPVECKVCGAQLPSGKLLTMHVLKEHYEQNAHKDQKPLTCVFSSCGATFASPAAHTEHLLQAHQLRVLSAPKELPPSKRGRPPKEKPVKPLRLNPVKVNNVKPIETRDPLELDDDDDDGYEVIIVQAENESLPLAPKYKMQSMFQ